MQTLKKTLANLDSMAYTLIHLFSPSETRLRLNIMAGEDSIIRSIVQKLDRRGAKIESLKRLLRDPDIADIIGEALKDGRTSNLKHRAAKPKAGQSLRETIVSLGPSLPQPFTAIDVLQALQQHRFAFNSEDHKTSVGNALYKLAKGRRIRLTEQSKGGTPNKYQCCP